MKNLIVISIVFVISVNYTFSQCSNPYAGQDTAFCGNTGELSVENATSGYWTANVLEGDLSAAIVFYPSSTSEEISITTSGLNVIFELVWIDESGPCNDTVLVEFVEQPLVYAGEDQIVCGNTFTMNATGTGTGFEWILDSSNYFEDINDPTTIAMTSIYFGYHYFCEAINYSTVSEIVCLAKDTVLITAYWEPTANMITDISDTIFNCGIVIEGLEAEDPGEPGFGITGAWVSNTNFFPTNGTNIDDLIADLMPNTYGYVDFYWVEQSGPYELACRDSAGPLTVYFAGEQFPYAGEDDDAWGYEYELQAENLASPDNNFPISYLWSGAGVSFNDQSLLNATAAVENYGIFELSISAYYVDYSDCASSDEIIIHFQDPYYQQGEGVYDLDPSINPIGYGKKGKNRILDDLSFEKEEFDVFPNPAKDILTIQADFQVSDICIYDMNGRVVLKPIANNNTINVSELECGVYYLKILTENNQMNYKFVKQ